MRKIVGVEGNSSVMEQVTKVLTIIRLLSLTRRQRRLFQSAVVGLAVAGAILGVQWAGLFSSAQVAASDYLYDTHGDPGDDIVVVAIDDKSQRALGDWPWSFAPYVQLFERLGSANVVGFDVLLADPGPQGNLDAPALVEAVKQACCRF